MVKVNKLLYLFTFLISVVLGALICFFVLSGLGKINTKTSLEITINDIEETYTGLPITPNSFTYDGSLAKGDYIDLTYTTSLTNVGEVKSTADAHVYSNDGADVTSNYNISVISGTISVVKKEIYVTANKSIDYKTNTSDVDLTNVYKLVDSTIPTNMFLYPFFQQEGEIDRTKGIEVSCKVLNKVTYEDESNNFNIEIIDKASLAKIPLSITTLSLSKEYDGTPLEVDETSIDYNSSELYSGDRLVYNGKYSSITEVLDSGAQNYIDINQIQILDSNNKDVTSLYKLDILNYGTLNIEKKKIVVTTNSFKKEYDGKDIAQSDISCTISDNLENYFKITYDVIEDKDSYKDANTYKNKVTISLKDGLNLDNYDLEDITYEEGSITITKKEIKAISNDVNAEFNNKTLEDNKKLDFKLLDSDEELKDNFDANYDLKDTKDAGMYTNVFTLSLKSGNSANYNITYIYGIVTISKKRVTITSNTISKKLTSTSIITGLIIEISDSELETIYKDENNKNEKTFIVTFMYSKKNLSAGVYQNYYTFSFKDSTSYKQSNYEFILNYGTITIS